MRSILLFSVSVNRAVATGQSFVEIPSSKFCVVLAEFFVLNGFFSAYSDVGGKLKIFFRFVNGKSAFLRLHPVSKPSLKVFTQSKNIAKGLFVIVNSENGLVLKTSSSCVGGKVLFKIS